MDKLTHLNALRAAARVAFGVAVLGGCTAAAAEEDTASSEASINTATKEKDDCPSKADSGAKPDAKLSCDELIAASFPGVDPDEYVWEPKPGASAELQACCKDQLLENGASMAYRFHCCTVVDRTGDDPGWQLGAACTPWGPPVPPKMRAVA